MIQQPDYVMRILSKEADDISVGSITRYDWYVDALPLKDLRVAEELLERHDWDAVYIDRGDRIETRITAGGHSPLIALGERLFLVDGGARYRALWCLNIARARVLRQRVTA